MRSCLALTLVRVTSKLNNTIVISSLKSSLRENHCTFRPQTFNIHYYSLIALYLVRKRCQARFTFAGENPPHRQHEGFLTRNAPDNNNHMQYNYMRQVSMPCNTDKYPSLTCATTHYSPLILIFNAYMPHTCFKLFNIMSVLQV